MPFAGLSHAAYQWQRKKTRNRVAPSADSQTEQDSADWEQETGNAETRRTNSEGSRTLGAEEVKEEPEVIEVTVEVAPPPKPPEPPTYEYYAGNGEGQWDHEDFALICFATASNFSNIASFPALCRENGGVIFIIMYILLEMSLALPITYLEMIIGQFSKSAVIGVWRLCPLFKGIGITLAILMFGLLVYFPVLVSWLLQYAMLAITETYDWNVCHNVTTSWNTLQCREDEDADTVNTTVVRATEEYFRIKIVGEKWKGDMVNGTPIYGLTNPGTPSGPLVAYLILIYIMVLLVISFGPRFMGRAAHSLSAMPVMFLAVLLLRGLSLAGAWQGLSDLLEPNFSFLVSPTTWSIAISLVVSSTQCGQGYYVTYASYNQFRKPIFRYALLTICMDLLSSILGGLTVFSFLGHSGYRRHANLFPAKNLSKTVSGETIIFELLPEAFSRIPEQGHGEMFAFMFFMTAFCKTVDNVALMVDTLTTAVTETFGKSLRRMRKTRSVVTFLIILSAFVLNVTFTTPGGVYLMEIFKAVFGQGGTNYLVCCFLMLFAVTCVFGESGVKFALERMTGNSKGFHILRVVWVLYSLPFVGFLVLVGCVRDVFGAGLEYHNFPIRGGKIAAGVLIYASMLAIPIVMLVVLAKSPSTGSKSKFMAALTPEHEQSSTSVQADTRGFWAQCPCISWFTMNRSRDKFQRSYEKASQRRHIQEPPT